MAIMWLKKHFREAFLIDDLARRVGMSLPVFNQWFRGIPGLSQLQYQKQLRLQEAQNLLRNERKDVATVSRRVGYNSASQFSRLFGNPPVREIGNRTSYEGKPSLIHFDLQRHPLLGRGSGPI
jgi:transcriptional regulator GlxA family with amidase domain